MSKIGIYPGSFDPITYGHLDIIQRSLSVVDELVIAVSNNNSKNHLISIDDRLNLINQSILSLPEKDLSKIKVETDNTTKGLSNKIKFYSCFSRKIFIKN